MSSTKEIQRRIKSVKNTKKITRAMEMVSAAKMRKAIEAVLRTRTYANLSWLTVLNIANSSRGEILHQLLAKPKLVNREAIVLISSNRGLCGSFNSAVIQKSVNSIRKHPGNKVDFIVVGKKGLAVKSRFNFNVVADFHKNDTCYQVKEIAPLAKLIINDFLSGKYDCVMVAYTDFVSPLSFVPRVKQILPIDLDARDHHLGIVGLDPKIGLDKEFINKKEEKYFEKEKGLKAVLKFEPSPEEVLNEILPRLIEVQIFQAVLESNASEHSARMASMHQATEAAKDLINELVLFYNKIRQAGITREISEIVAGANTFK